MRRIMINNENYDNDEVVKISKILILPGSFLVGEDVMLMMTMTMMILMAMMMMLTMMIAAPACGEGEFSCQGGGCVPQRWTCDAEEVRMT